MTGGSMRLAIRAEGNMVNAYVATTENMQGALHIGCMSRAVLEMRPALFDSFKALMVDAMTAVVETGTNAKVIGTHEQPAPEHEKAGRA